MRFISHFYTLPLFKMAFNPAPRSKSAINSQYKKGPLVDCLIMYQAELDRKMGRCELLEYRAKNDALVITKLAAKVKKLESEATLSHQLKRTAENIDNYVRVELPKMAQDIDTGIRSTLKAVDNNFNWTI